MKVLYDRLPFGHGHKMPVYNMPGISFDWHAMDGTDWANYNSEDIESTAISSALVHSSILRLRWSDPMPLRLCVARINEAFAFELGEGVDFEPQPDAIVAYSLPEDVVTDDTQIRLALGRCTLRGFDRPEPEWLRNFRLFGTTVTTFQPLHRPTAWERILMDDSV